jgi:hypothetical protein
LFKVWTPRREVLLGQGEGRQCVEYFLYVLYIEKVWKSRGKTKCVDYLVCTVRTVGTYGRSAQEKEWRERVCGRVVCTRYKEYSTLLWTPVNTLKWGYEPCTVGCSLNCTCLGEILDMSSFSYL